MKVRELLDKSDAELRDWLNTHGAANIRIEHDGTATLEPATSDKFRFNSGDAAAATGEMNFDVKAADDTESKAATNLRDAENANQRDAIQEEYAELSKAEVTAAESRLEVAKAVLEKLKAQQQAAADLQRQAEYQRAYAIQQELAELERRATPAVVEKRKRQFGITDATERVQIALSTGERGSFSRPGRRFVRAERVETADAKNILTITITGDGLEFLGGEPGAGVIRCWDQKGEMIEVAVEVKASPLPNSGLKTGLDTKPAPILQPKANRTKPEEPKAPPTPAENLKSEFDAKVERLLNAQAKPDAKLERKSLARRLYLDYLGVPPTAEEINEFVGDGKPETIENSVRELHKRIEAKPQSRR